MTGVRPSTLLFAGIGGGTLLLLALLGQAAMNEGKAARRCADRRIPGILVTDFCLFTEARYTRHPALADLHAPFQQHPSALEHFPSGSILQPGGRP